MWLIIRRPTGGKPFFLLILKRRGQIRVGISLKGTSLHTIDFLFIGGYAILIMAYIAKIIMH